MPPHTLFAVLNMPGPFASCADRAASLDPGAAAHKEAFMRNPFVPSPDTQNFALAAVGAEVRAAVAICQKGEPFFQGRLVGPFKEGLATAAYIEKISEQQQAHFPAVLALTRYELPAYSERHEFIGPLNRVDRLPAVFLDSYQTAWAVLAKGWPISVRLRVADGRFIRPDYLERWARGDLERQVFRAGDIAG